MYLAKFFHRPPGDDDRELLFIPGESPMIIGIHMHAAGESQREDFLREEFSDVGAAVSVYRRHVAKLVAAGYTETTHTRYTLRNLLPDPQPKPDWQKGLDELMLAALSAPLEEQAKRLTALQQTPSARRCCAIIFRSARKKPLTLPINGTRMAAMRRSPRCPLMPTTSRSA